MIGNNENSLLTNAFGGTDLFVINGFNCILEFTFIEKIRHIFYFISFELNWIEFTLTQFFIELLEELSNNFQICLSESSKLDLRVNQIFKLSTNYCFIEKVKTLNIRVSKYKTCFVLY